MKIWYKFWVSLISVSLTVTSFSYPAYSSAEKMIIPTIDGSSVLGEVGEPLILKGLNIIPGQVLKFNFLMARVTRI